MEENITPRNQLREFELNPREGNTPTPTKSLRLISHNKNLVSFGNLNNILESSDNSEIMNS